MKRFGFKPADLKLATTEQEGGLKYTIDDKKIGASVLTLAFTFENGDVRSFTQSFSVRRPIPIISKSKHFGRIG